MWNKKIYLSVICLFLSILPFAIFNYHVLVSPNYWPDEAPWLISYSSVLILCVWLYKLKSETKFKPSAL